MKFLALGEIVEILDSKRRPISKKDRKQGPYPYYGATGIVDYIDGYIFDEELVLVGEDGAKWKSMDNTAFTIKGKTWVNNHAHVLRPNNEILLNQFLIYYLNFKDLSEFVKGITVPKLNQTNLKLIPIPTPSLQEQEEIVKRLDKVFENIGNKEEKESNSIELYDKLYKSKLNQIFSNEFMRSGETELSELSEIISGQSPKGEFINDSEGLEFHQGKKAFSDKFLLDSGKRTQYTTKQIPKNTIVMSVRAPVGPVNITQESICIGRGLAGIIPQGSNLDFLFYYLDSIKDENTGHVGATINSINRNEIMKIKIPNLSISKQETIANQIQQILELKNELVCNSREVLTKLNNLKKSILNNEFSYE